MIDIKKTLSLLMIMSTFSFAYNNENYKKKLDDLYNQIKEQELKQKQEKEKQKLEESKFLKEAKEKAEKAKKILNNAYYENYKNLLEKYKLKYFDIDNSLYDFINSKTEEKFKKEVYNNIDKVIKNYFYYKKVNFIGPLIDEKSYKKIENLPLIYRIVYLKKDIELYMKNYLKMVTDPTTYYKYIQPVNENILNFYSKTLLEIYKNNNNIIMQILNDKFKYLNKNFTLKVKSLTQIEILLNYFNSELKTNINLYKKQYILNEKKYLEKLYYIVLENKYYNIHNIYNYINNIYIQTLKTDYVFQKYAYNQYPIIYKKYLIILKKQN